MTPQAYRDMASVQDRHWWFQARRRILEDELAALALPPHARILEIGSGTGANLALLARFGRVTGIEMSAEAIAAARTASPANAGIELVQGRFPEDAQALGGPFDLVCLFDVLEHIPDDRGALAAVRERVAPQGRVLITVPAYRWLWSAHDAQLHHQRRYRLRELERLCAECGLRVKRASYFNTLLFPLAAAGRIADRVLRRETSSGSAVPAAPVNALLHAAFASERHLLRRVRLPFGLSILLVAERRA